VKSDRFDSSHSFFSKKKKKEKRKEKGKNFSLVWRWKVFESDRTHYLIFVVQRLTV
jgi:hypothetical protein